MKITKYGHACLLIEEGKARLLVDPGNFSQGFENLTELDGILITHQHADHMVPDKIKALLDRNDGARVYADETSAEILSEQGIQATAVRAGDSFEVGGVSVEVIGRDHAIIHPDIPRILDVGYLVDGRFFYPGDALTDPKRPVEVLAAPLGAPWMKLSEAVDYVRQVKPKVAIPVHDAVLAMPEMHVNMMRRLTEEQGVEIRVVENGESTEV